MSGQPIWYFLKDDSVCGPESSLELKNLANSGIVLPTTLIRQGEEGEWVPAKRVRGLFESSSEKRVQLPAAVPNIKTQDVAHPSAKRRTRPPSRRRNRWIVPVLSLAIPIVIFGFLFGFLISQGKFRGESNEITLAESEPELTKTPSSQGLDRVSTQSSPSTEEPSDNSKELESGQNEIASTSTPDQRSESNSIRGDTTIVAAPLNPPKKSSRVEPDFSPSLPKGNPLNGNSEDRWERIENAAVQGLTEDGIALYFTASQEAARNLGLNPDLAAENAKMTLLLRGVLIVSGVYEDVQGPTGPDSIDELAARCLERANNFVPSRAGQKMSLLAGLSENTDDPGIKKLFKQVQQGSAIHLLHLSDMDFANAVAQNSGFSADGIMNTLRSTNMLANFYLEGIRSGSINLALILSVQHSDFQRHFSRAISNKLTMLSRRQNAGNISMEEVAGVASELTEQMFQWEPSSWKDNKALAAQALKVLLAHPKSAKLFKGMSSASQQVEAMNILYEPMNQAHNIGLLSRNESTLELMAVYGKKTRDEVANYYREVAR